MPKKDGRIRVCVDFRDLNKASPNDDFSLPHIDELVNFTAGHAFLSFMDGFFGYNQILMHPSDREYTSFITDRGTYHYQVMPFGDQSWRRPADLCEEEDNCLWGQARLRSE